MESSRAFEVGDLVSEVAPREGYGDQGYVVEFEDGSDLVFFAHKLTLVRSAS